MSRDPYATYRQGLIGRILAEGLTPIQVAVDLEAKSQQFPQIQYAECRALRQMGDSWTKTKGPTDVPDSTRSVKLASPLFDGMDPSGAS